MQVKTFTLAQEQEANEFINNHVLLEDGAVQVTSDSTIVIFYKSPNDDYEEWFKKEMIANLKRNLFHEEIRKVSVEAEINHYKDKGGKSDNFDKAFKNSKDAEDNIRTFKAKIAALEEWTAKPTSNE